MKWRQRSARVKSEECAHAWASGGCQPRHADSVNGGHYAVLSRLYTPDRSSLRSRWLLVSGYVLTLQHQVKVESSRPVNGTLTCLLYTSPSPRDRQKSR